MPLEKNQLMRRGYFVGVKHNGAVIKIVILELFKIWLAKNYVS
jgi:hypothetical protein